MSFLFTWLATAIAVIVAANIIPNVRIVGSTWSGALFAALAIALVNATILPVMHFLAIPLTIITFGLFAFVVNALAFQMASWLSVNIFGMGIEVNTFGAAIGGSLIVSIVSALIAMLFGA